MNRIFLVTIVLVLIISTPVAGSAQRKVRKQKYPIGGSYPDGSKLKVVPDLTKRLSKFKAVQMPFDQKGLSAKEVRMVGKLVEASRYLEYIFWRQNDPEALTMYQQLTGSRNPRDRQLLRYLFINGSRFDFTDDNKPFVGTDTMSPGRGLYPHDLTKTEIEKYVQAHPEKKDELYSRYTVVRRHGNDLEGLPYKIAYRSFLDPAAKALREAASLSDDRAFAEFLRKRADALLTDDYFPSDLLWVGLNNPKFDVSFAPYLVYLDGLLGVKTSYGAAVMIRNEAESKKLAVFQKFVPDIQEALPLAAQDKPDTRGQAFPMEVMDTPYRAGDLLHGYQAVAANLPLDPRVREEKGSKKIFFKNFMDARVRYVIVPVARRLMRPDQAAQVSASGYLSIVMMHEISHGLGPLSARTPNGKEQITEALGPIFSPLEEAKADVVGMFGTKWLVDHHELPASRLPEFYASYVAGVLRSVRFGVAEAHGRAEMMEFNYLVEQGVIRRDTGAKPVHTIGKHAKTPSARYVVDYAKMPDAITSLSKELLEIEATGDRSRAENWFAKYDKMPPELKSALDGIGDVPVDIYPVFTFPDIVE